MKPRTARARHAVVVGAALLPDIAPRWMPLALAALLALAVWPGAAPQVATAHADCYTFTLLKEPEDTQLSWASAINNRGQVVGVAQSMGRGVRPILWEGDQVRELGTLGGEAAIASAINDAGDVVGASQVGNPDPNAPTPWQAFLYRGGSMVGLGPLGGPRSYATGINASGEILGTVWSPDGSSRSFVWRDGATRDLGVAGATLGINDAGQVVGSHISNGSRSAFLWQDGKLRDLGLPPGMQVSAAVGLNDAGQVLVGGFDARRRQRAFMWQDGAWVREFDPQGQWEFIPRAINNAGQVVGAGGPESGPYRGMLWDADGDRHELAKLTCGASAGWDLRAEAINDAGQVVGAAVPGGGATPHAFLLTAPRPPAMWPQPGGQR